MLHGLDDKYGPIKQQVSETLAAQLSEVGITPEMPKVVMYWPSTASYTFNVCSDLRFAELAAVIDSAFCDDARLSSLLKGRDGQYLVTLTVDVQAVLAVEFA